MSRLKLRGLSIAFLFTSGIVNGATPAETQDIIEKWVATQEAKSEVVYVQMTRRAKPDARPEQIRFVVVHEQSGDGVMDYFLRVVRPVDVQGVTLLVNQKGPANIKRHLFLPAIGKARELTGAARYQPLLGSDISFAELEREVPSVNSYERLADTTAGSLACYKIRASETDRTKDSPYEFRDLYIDKETHRLRQIDFIGTGGKAVKVLTASEYDSDEMDGSTKRPRRLEMKNNVTGSVTELLVVEGRIDVEIPDEVFTPARHETWHQSEVDNFIFNISEIVVEG